MHGRRIVGTWAGVVLAAGILAGAGPAAGQGRTVIYGSIAEPQALNPLMAPDVVSKQINEMLFAGLVAFGEGQVLQPKLATAWEVSGDGLTWTFHLRKDVRWHDGRELTAEDVKFTYDQILDPKSAMRLARSDYLNLKRVEVVDKHTVRFLLDAPFAPFLSTLVVGIVPKHVLAGQDLRTTPFNRRPVGNGPFKVKAWDAAQKVVLEAHPEYFGGRPGLDGIIWKVVPDSNVLTIQLESGEVHVAPVINAADVPRLARNPRLRLSETLGFNTYLGLNLANPLFADGRVRRALAQGIDREAIIEKIMDGRAVPATSDLLPGTWAHNPQVRRYPYRPAEAKALLAQAGWRPGPDGVLVKDGQRLRFTLLTNAGDKNRERIILVARQQWGALGVEVEPQFLELNTFIRERVLKRQYEAMLIGSSVPLDPDFLYRRYHTKSIPMEVGHNFLNYRNAEVDALLDRGRATADVDARRRAYFRVQEILADEVATLPLYHPKVTYGAAAGLAGLAPIPTNLFWNTERWTLAR